MKRIDTVYSEINTICMRIKFKVHLDCRISKIFYLLSLFIATYSCSPSKDGKNETKYPLFYSKSLNDTFSFKNISSLCDSILSNKAIYPFKFYEHKNDSVTESIIAIHDEFDLKYKLTLEKKIKNELFFQYNYYTKFILSRTDKKMYCITKKSYTKDSIWNSIFLLDDYFRPVLALKKEARNFIFRITKYKYYNRAIYTFIGKIKLEEVTIKNNFYELKFAEVDKCMQKIFRMNIDFKQGYSLDSMAYGYGEPLWTDPVQHY